jgi:hypothetical protein
VFLKERVEKWFEPNGIVLRIFERDDVVDNGDLAVCNPFSNQWLLIKSIKGLDENGVRGYSC